MSARFLVQKSCKGLKKRDRWQQGAAMAELPELWELGEISVSSFLDWAPQQGMNLTLNCTFQVSDCHCVPDSPSGLSEGMLNWLNSILSWFAHSPFSGFRPQMIASTLWPLEGKGQCCTMCGPASGWDFVWRPELCSCCLKPLKQIYAVQCHCCYQVFSVPFTTIPISDNFYASGFKMNFQWY